MIPELCPTDWNHRDKRSLTFPSLLKGGRTAERKSRKKGEIKACEPKKIGGLGMEICLNSEGLSVVLYGAEAKAVLVMGYHPQRRGEKSADC